MTLAPPARGFHAQRLAAKLTDVYDLSASLLTVSILLLDPVVEPVEINVDAAANPHDSVGRVQAVCLLM
jgi:hypothetical protein